MALRKYALCPACDQDKIQDDMVFQCFKKCNMRDGAKQKKISKENVPTSKWKFNWKKSWRRKMQSGICWKRSVDDFVISISGKQSEYI